MHAEWTAAVEAAGNELGAAGHRSLLLVGYSLGAAVAVVAARTVRPDGLTVLAPFWWPESWWTRMVEFFVRPFLPIGCRPGSGWFRRGCQQLAEASDGELLLFTDADTRHGPQSVRHGVAALEAEGADLLTALPHEETVTLAEQLVVPVIPWSIFTFLPLALAYRRRSPALSATIGQHMLFRKSAYAGIGGHAAVRSDPAGDSLPAAHRRAARPPAGRHPVPALDTGITLIGLASGLASWGLCRLRFGFPLRLLPLYPITILLALYVAFRSVLLGLWGRTTWKGRNLGQHPVSWW